VEVRKRQRGWQLHRTNWNWGHKQHSATTFITVGPHRW